MINRFTQQMIILASEIENELENVHKQEPDWKQIDKALWKLRKQWEMINFLREHQNEIND
jgi:hypothetical protein